MKGFFYYLPDTGKAVRGISWQVPLVNAVSIGDNLRESLKQTPL